MNCRLFDASLRALLKHGWFGVERAVAEALRRVQRLVAGRDGVDDCLRPVCFGLAGVARSIRCQGHERTVPDAVCSHGFSPANPRRTQCPTWGHQIWREPPAREAVGELAWPQGPPTGSPWPAVGVGSRALALAEAMEARLQPSRVDCPGLVAGVALRGRFIRTQAPSPPQQYDRYEPG